MIKSITIENFFSFAGKTEIELNPGVNMLVGINGSGKTNFLRALRLAKAVYFSDENTDNLIMRDWGGLSKVVNSSKGNQGEVYVDVEFLNSKRNSKDKEKGFSLLPTGSDSYVVFPGKPQSKDGIHIEQDGETVKFIDKVTGKELSWNKTSISGLIRGYSEILSLAASAHGAFKAKDIDSILLLYDNFDISRFGPIRKLGEYDRSPRLRNDGSNLTTLLNRIKSRHSSSFDAIEEALLEVNPKIRDINFEIIGSNILLSVREVGLERSVTIEHISDGTIRYLLLLSILLNPERGDIICLDEPEIGLHPDMIAGVARLIQKAAAEGTQIFVATHSPMLLNAFELEDIIVFEKDAENKTIIKRPSLEDFEADESRLPGFLWLSGRIGGTRW